MRVIKVNVYKFDELSKDVKEKVLEDFRNDEILYVWDKENQKTLETFKKHFDFVDIETWEYGFGNSFINFSIADDDISEMDGYKFYKYLKNNGYLTIKELYKEGYKKLDDNCCLTGYCVDIDILEPILKLMKKPSIYKNTTAFEIIRKCLNNWLKCCKDDLEYSYTDEAIEELIVSNDYEFTKEGELI